MWQVTQICPMMPFRYLVSGGVSMRGLMPGWTFSWWRVLEKQLAPLSDHMAMFSLIVLEHRTS
jgi:hypothetical protein